MSYTSHSTLAPTGASPAAKVVVSPNEYAPEGRNTSYPTKFDIYVIKISDVDGSVQVNGEPHTLDQFVGNRLYLYHRPMVDINGTVAVVTPSAGTIVQASTNAKQGYVEFSALPTSDFTVSYLASPDCFNHWQQNNMQASIMAIQGQLGPTNQTGWPGLRNVNAAIFDTPNDDWNTLLPNLVSLPNLPRDVRISSSAVDALTGTLGDRHRIQIGRRADDIHLEGTGIRMGSVAGYSPDSYADIWLSNRTGDRVFIAGTISGHDQMTIGGPGALVAGYSGFLANSAVSGASYTGAMLRVHGDAYVQGNVVTHGTITLVTTTGETSTVLGDFTIRDELYVYGISHLIGPTETNALHTFEDFTLDGNLVAGNVKGAGDRGHTLIDNLDASEVAHTYKTVTRKNIDNYVIKAPKSLDLYDPKRVVYSPDYTISGRKLVGDEFGFTGFFTAAPSHSGAYNSILQLQFSSGTMPIVSGFFDGTEKGLADGGYFSKSLIDPGSLWVEVLAPSDAAGYKAPIYGYTIQETQGDYLTKLNAYTPAQPSNVVNANDSFLLYSPGCEHYNYITSAGGASPTVTVTATSDTEIQVAFEDEVRIFDSNSAATSITQALEYSTSGATPGTGVAYVFASKNNIDIEANPTVVTRATPFRMPGETIIGEVVASGNPGGSWTILETTSYRPGGLYDSAWIPIRTGEVVTAGRCASWLSNVAAEVTGNRWFFNHNLGADMHFSDVNVTLHLASYGTQPSSNVHPNQYRAFVHSLWGADSRGPVGVSGAFTSMQLNNVGSANDGPEANVFYMDGKVIGIQFHDDILNAPRLGQGPFNHMRLVMKRTS